MTTAQELMDAQCSRLTKVDPELPSSYPLPQGEPIMARVAGGQPVAGLITHANHPPLSQQSLWSAADTYELFPLIGNHPQEGMDALLHAWRARLAEQGAPSTDSSCVITWPSRDVQAARTFLNHGLVPLSCMAFRSSAPNTDTDLPDSVTIRRAGLADLDAVVELTLAELEYAALVGASILRPDAARMKRMTAHVRLYAADKPEADPVWLAEQDGVAIALAECGWVDTNTQPIVQRLKPGRWAYVNCVSVHENARASGIGRQLMALAHNEFAHAGVLGSFLYYNPANPLSSVFWPRQGYRPLWTTWEVRPATALR